MFKKAYAILSRLFPTSVHAAVDKLIVQGGFKLLNKRQFLGFALFFSLSAAVVSFFTAQLLSTDTTIHLLAPVAGIIVSLVLVYFMLLATADARAREVELYLPYALQLISSNIRAGLTLENALWGAAKPEFGQLSVEVQRVSRDVFTGMPVSKALARMTVRVHSTVLERAVKLIVQGISLGGEMATLLDYVADDIHNIQLLQREIATSTITYSIFIVFAGVIASPLLFSVSVFYAEINEHTINQQAGAGNVDPAALQKAGLSGIPVIGVGGSKSLPASDLHNFALASVIITTISCAFIVGLMRYGKATRGLPYAPVFLGIGLFLFFSSLSLLNELFAPLLAAG